MHKVHVNACKKKKVLNRVLNVIFSLAEKGSIAVYVSLRV